MFHHLLCSSVKFLFNKPKSMRSVNQLSCFSGLHHPFNRTLSISDHLLHGVGCKCPWRRQTCEYLQTRTQEIRTSHFFAQPCIHSKHNAEPIYSFKYPDMWYCGFCHLSVLPQQLSLWSVSGPVPLLGASLAVHLCPVLHWCRLLDHLVLTIWQHHS